MSPLRKAIDAVGGVATAAKICEVSPRAIYKWLATGSLPRTEYTGETEHAKRLAAAAAVHGEPFTAEWLLGAAAPGAASSAEVAAERPVLRQAVSAIPTPEDRRHPKLQSVTPRRGRRAGDLTAVQFTQRLANAKAGEFPPEFKATDEYLDD